MRYCPCISRPTRSEEEAPLGRTWIVKIKSDCPVHFKALPARARLNVMIREIVEGE